MSINSFSFKTLFWSYTCCAIPFMLIAGLLSFFNFSAVYFNNKPVYGILGFLVTVICIPMTGFIMATTNWLALNFGRLIYNLVFRYRRKQN